ncbi:hypothetical protein [Tepidibacter hydrothermalis]|uniref:Uncharacterized protein n=1 Tax=Tepidibacter hydrothermalis TaxID=3036126 RepID=A0ABY8EEZ6_9FIRM|nr:hypothetical protein [Tepidibacter hydrothermalis]WFD11516.1 hypothetical protein P4S50_05420 [Tepidibacter hydrothermalis]
MKKTKQIVTMFSLGLCLLVTSTNLVKGFINLLTIINRSDANVIARSLGYVMGNMIITAIIFTVLKKTFKSSKEGTTYKNK